MVNFVSRERRDSHIATLPGWTTSLAETAQWYLPASVQDFGAGLMAQNAWFYVLLDTIPGLRSAGDPLMSDRIVWAVRAIDK